MTLLCGEYAKAAFCHLFSLFCLCLLRRVPLVHCHYPFTLSLSTDSERACSDSCRRTCPDPFDILMTGSPKNSLQTNHIPTTFPRVATHKYVHPCSPSFDKYEIIPLTCFSGPRMETTRVPFRTDSIVCSRENTQMWFFRHNSTFRRRTVLH